MASIIHASSHGLAANDPIQFYNLIPSTSGINENAVYYVLAAGLTTDTFQFSETVGGAAFILSNAITNGSLIRADGVPDYAPVTAGPMVIDIDAPGQPQAVTAVAGFRGVALAWTPAVADDLRFYQVRWGIDGATWPNLISVRVTTMWVPDLDPDILHYFQVRAIDVSDLVACIATATGVTSTDTFTVLAGHPFLNNQTVRLSALTGGSGLSIETTYYIVNRTATTFQLSLTQGGAAVDLASDVSSVLVTLYPNSAVNYLEFPEAGWTAVSTAIPSQVGSADIAANTITSAMISTGGLVADVIKGGTITVAPTGASVPGATAITIKNSTGVVQGEWDPTTGIKIFATNPANYCVIDDAYIRFYQNNILTAELGPDGIKADSLRLGTLAGGHNLIPNSSFELGAFTSGQQSRTFTDNSGTPGWKAANRFTSPDNVTEGATELTATALSF